MNCATHTRYCRSGFLPHLRQAALRQLHPRRSRSHLLRALPRRPFGRHRPGSRIRASAQPCIRRLAGAATAFAGSGPNPAVAGILAGFFPFGVGAVYCSQYAKGLAHLLIFAMLIFGSDHAGNWDWLFGIGIAFFYVYQIIDAVRTAHALQAGQPAPDPLGLGQTFSMGEKFDSGKVPVGAVILIGLGVLFLLHTMGIMEFGFERFWPLILIFLGGWMFSRQLGAFPANLWLRTLQHALADGPGHGAHHRHPVPVPQP